MGLPPIKVIPPGTALNIYPSQDVLTLKCKGPMIFATSHAIFHIHLANRVYKAKLFLKSKVSVRDVSEIELLNRRLIFSSSELIFSTALLHRKGSSRTMRQ